MKSKYFFHNFYEQYKLEGKTINELAKISIQHLCLGEVNAYHHIIINYFLKNEIMSKDNWIISVSSLLGEELDLINIDGVW